MIRLTIPQLMHLHIRRHIYFGAGSDNTTCIKVFTVFVDSNFEWQVVMYTLQTEVEQQDTRLCIFQFLIAPSLVLILLYMYSLTSAMIIILIL